MLQGEIDVLDSVCERFPPSFFHNFMILWLLCERTPAARLFTNFPAPESYSSFADIFWWVFSLIVQKRCSDNMQQGAGTIDKPGSMVI